MATVIGFALRYSVLCRVALRRTARWTALRRIALRRVALRPVLRD